MVVSPSGIFCLPTSPSNGIKWRLVTRVLGLCLLASKLRTLLQIQRHLSLALEASYQVGALPCRPTPFAINRS